MSGLDWIDLAWSRKQRDAAPSFDPDLHTSTASLLAQLLRRRPAPRGKAFVWLRADDVFEVTTTDGVFHIEATFPLALYANQPNDLGRLACLSSWLIAVLRRAAPELIKDDIEAAELAKTLADRNYNYLREERVRGGDPGFKACYLHTPRSVQVFIKHRRSLFSVPEINLMRSELVYSRSVTSANLSDDGVLVHTYEGRNFTGRPAPPNELDAYRELRSREPAPKV